jgi:hypothetical protein
MDNRGMTAQTDPAATAFNAPGFRTLIAKLKIPPLTAMLGM